MSILGGRHMLSNVLFNAEHKSKVKIGDQIAKKKKQGKIWNTTKLEILLHGGN